MGIRTRIILSFLSLLIAPFMIVFLALLIVNSNIFGEPITDSLENLSNHSDHVIYTFQDNFDLLEKTDEMDELIQPLMEGKFRRIVFADQNRIVRYDSANQLLAKSLSEMSDTGDSELETIDSDIYVEGQYMGTLVLVPDIDLAKAFKILMMLPIALIALFILTIIALIIILSKILADGIINPLRELNYAAERISAGDLDFEMTYDKDDEFGKLCNEFDRMRLKLKDSLSKQVQYEKSRRQLIASISHDLKTPLTSIKGYVEGLQDGLVTDEATYQRYLRVIWDKSNRLNHLIDDLFIFSKMELGEFKIDPVQVDSDMLLDELLSSRELELKEAEVDFHVEKPIPQAKLLVDVNRIGQVLDNLIDNALKFTKTRIHIHTAIENKSFSIFISDDGLGMDEEDLPYIFDHFYKIDKVRSTNAKGTGLGLAICKELIEAHDGTIHVKSRLGRGTTFKIMLPIK